MNNANHQTFVKAAIVAGELHQAMMVAHKLTITAANAKVLSIKAGSAAAGFGALTQHIDELAHNVIDISKSVNRAAVASSKASSEAERTKIALTQFSRAKQRATDAPFVDSFLKAYNDTQQTLKSLQTDYQRELKRLQGELEQIAGDLRGANVLATMSRVEATLVSHEHASALRDIADNVATAADTINHHIKQSQLCLAS